jgi:nucleotide-binding universal stress UspA family protein
MVVRTEETSVPEFKHILLPIDFSRCSQAALPYARSIAQLYGSMLHVVHVVGPEPLVGPLGVHYPKTEEEDAVAEGAFDALIQSGVLANVPHTRTIIRGVVWKVVSRLVADLRIDLVVLGTHGRSGLKKVMLGSVAEQIFRNAASPVLTVGPDVHNGLADGKLNTIVYATDFSQVSLGALRYARSFARVSRSNVIMVHAVHLTFGDEELTPVAMDNVVEGIKQKLVNLIPNDPGTRYEVVTKCEPARDLVLRVAKENRAELIVVGAHRGTTSHTPWAIAHGVICHASCPVLTVPG